MINKKSFIFISGHKGLVGSSILRRLKFYGYHNLITKTKKQLDLRDQEKVSKFFSKTKIDAVINAAGKVGGIHANNKYKANFIYDNIAIQNNIIHSSFQNNIKDLIFLGSSCIYPRNCKQPMKEKYLLTGPLEKTNEPYAIAKISGIKMCESYNYQYKTNYKCLMPCNLYGPNDNYHPENSHFLPALLNKIYQSKIKNKKIVKIWGTGKPKREVMFVDDLADACIFFLKIKTKETLINIGSGEEMNILQFTKFIIKKLNTNMKIQKDLSKPDGTPRKIVDISLAKKYGWKSKISFSDGLEITYKDFKKRL